MGAARKLEDNQIVMKKRRIQRSGSSYYVSIPPEFIKRLGISAGEEVAVLTKGNMVQIVVMPH
jgi:antitoxin component of MazEF toxin-antitoxin module